MSHYIPEWSRFVATFKGKKVSLADVKSFAAKAVRDGDENAAILWFRVLYNNKAKVWKQLLVRSVEDIGKGDLSAMDKLLFLKHRVARGMSGLVGVKRLSCARHSRMDQSSPEKSGCS